MRISDWSSDVCSSDLLSLNGYLAKLGLALVALEDIANELVQVQRNAFLRAFLEHHSDAFNHLSGAMAVARDALQRRARLLEFGTVPPEPAQSRIGICDHTGQRLVDLVRDRGRHCLHGRKSVLARATLRPTPHNQPSVSHPCPPQPD